MSKNIVDAIIEYAQEARVAVPLIPSRRQIENTGGYVNNWTTKQFAAYLEPYRKFIILQRDHAGPGQGLEWDDGYTSLEEDCKYFDYIHLDPWVAYPSYDQGLRETIKMIRFVYSRNPAIKLEVGTEEAIRPFSPDELECLMRDLKRSLSRAEFGQIKYLVIQSGTSLRGNRIRETYGYFNNFGRIKQRLLNGEIIPRVYHDKPWGAKKRQTPLLEWIDHKQLIKDLG